MGIDYKAAFFVGLPRKQFEDAELLRQYLDEGDLEICPPYYDGGDDDLAIVGFSVKVSGTYAPVEFTWDQEQVDRLKSDFKQLTELEAKVWLSPLGY